MAFFIGLGFLVDVLNNAMFGSHDVSHLPSLKPIFPTLLKIDPRFFLTLAKYFEIELSFCFVLLGRFALDAHYIL